MALKSNLDPPATGVYFALNGKSEFDGATPERPKPKIQEAIDVAEASSPSPSPGNTYSVIAAQGGNFTESVVMADSVLLRAEDVTMVIDAPVALTAANLTNITSATIINNQDGGAVFKIDGKSSFGVQLLYCSCEGENSSIYEVTGTCSSLFLNVNSNQVVGDDGICYNFTGVADTVLFFNAEEIDLLGNDCIGIRWAGTGTGSSSINAITSNAINARSGTVLLGISTIAFKIESGTYVADIGVSNTDALCIVESGARLDLGCLSASGNILVEAGGVLNCIIVEFTGNIVNNGIINGIIDGQYFGTYRQKPFETTLIAGSSLVNQMPSALDDPIQIEYGAAQGSGSDPVEIDVDGEVTINITDQYVFSFGMQYGRTGAAGGAANLFFRILVDGTQVGESIFARLNNPNTNIPSQFERILDLTAGQTVTTELLRDSSGTNFGGLIAADPTPAGWANSASASIRVSRRRLVSE